MACLGGSRHAADWAGIDHGMAGQIGGLPRRCGTLWGRSILRASTGSSTDDIGGPVAALTHSPHACETSALFGIPESHFSSTGSLGLHRAGIVRALRL